MKKANVNKMNVNELSTKQLNAVKGGDPVGGAVPKSHDLRTNVVA